MKAKNGISLIVLVITIVVIIILAAAVILSLNNNNPINNSRVASLSQTRDNLESAVSMYLSNRFSRTMGEYDALTILSNGGNGIAINTTTYGTDWTAVITYAATAPLVVDGVNFYEINTANAKTALEIDITKEAGTWYLAPSTGKVYVKYGTTIPSYLMDGTKVNASVASFVTQ